MKLQISNTCEIFPDVFLATKQEKWSLITSRGHKKLAYDFSTVNYLLQKIRNKIQAVTIIEPPFTMFAPVKPQKGICETGKPCWRVDELNLSKVPVLRCCIGFSVDLAKQLEIDLKFSTDMYIVEDGLYGIAVNGSYNGMIGDLLKGKADVIFAPITVTLKRSKVVDFTEPYLTSGIGLATIINRDRVSFFNLDVFAPLSPNLWIGTFVIAFFVSFVLHFMVNIVKIRKCRYTWKESITYLAGLVFQRDIGGENPVGSGARVAAISVAMFMMIVMSSYTAMLTANKVTYSDSLPISGFKDNKVILKE